MPKITNISSGANAILIAYLRQHKGSITVNCSKLSRQYNLSRNHVWVAAKHLSRLGLLTMKHNGKKNPPLLALNEEAIKKYGAGTLSSHAISSKGPKVPRNQPFGSVPQEVAKLLQNLEAHTFTNPEQVKPLFETAGVLHSRCGEFASVLESRQTEIAKLEEALKGFGMNDEEIGESFNITAEEIAGVAEYEELGTVPVIDFTKLVVEPANIFKPLALLQAKTRVLRNLLIEIQRETSRMNLLRQKLETLLKEKQEVEIDGTEILAALADWKRFGDRYVRRVCASGLAVVSSRE